MARRNPLTQVLATERRSPSRMRQRHKAMFVSRDAGAFRRICHGRHRLLQAVPPNAGLSCEHGFHDFAMYVGQAIVAALEFECQPRVIDTQAVQQRGVQIVDVDWVLGDVV